MVKSGDYIEEINETLNGRKFSYGKKLKKELRGLHEKWNNSKSIGAFLEYIKHPPTEGCSILAKL